MRVFGGSEIRENIIFQPLSSSLWNHGNHAGTELCSVSWTSRRPAETLFLPLTLTVRTEGRTAHTPHLFWNGSTSTSGCQLESEFSLFLTCVTWYWVFEAVELLCGSLHIKSTKVAAYVKETCANKTFSLHMHGLWFHSVKWPSCTMDVCIVNWAFYKQWTFIEFFFLFAHT